MIRDRRGVLERINDACEQFEAELKKENAVEISHWVKLVAEDDRPELFYELLSLEAYYHSETSNITEYFGRYPEYSNEIVRVFSEKLSRKQEESNSVSWMPGIDPLEPGDQFERFQIISVLGAGGFSIVYLAHDPLLNKAVALKVLNCKEETGPQYGIECLINEANVLGRIDHPSIPKIHDVGEDKYGNPWVAREFIKGQSLYQLLATDQLSVAEVLRILVKTALALNEVHRSGFAHRDIKPDNIVIELDGEPRILDYGLAIHEDVQQQHSGERAGTTHFMSPEQVRGQNENLDGRTDIWSLGVILYLVITNRLPFQGTEKEDVRRNILNQPVKPPRQVKDNFATVELETICFRALKKDPEQRFPTAQDFADALQSAIENLPAEFLLQEESRSRVLSKQEECSILLARQSRFWNDHPHNDNLPGVFRYLKFRFRTSNKLWTDSERKMMRASLFHFAKLGCVLATLVLASLFASQLIQRQNKDARVLEVIAKIKNCPLNQVQSRFDELSAFAPRKCLASVEHAFASTSEDDDERIRYAIILAPRHPEFRSIFQRGLLNAKPEEIETLRALAFGPRDSTDKLDLQIDPELRQHLPQFIATTPFVNGLESVWPNPPADFNANFQDYGGQITSSYAWCGSMHLDTFKLMNEKLRDFRYRPVCIRPWRNGKDDVTRLAAIWHRSSADWKVEYNLTPKLFMSLNSREPMHLVDVSDGLEAPGEDPKLVAIWSNTFDGRAEAKQMLLADRIPELKRREWKDESRFGIISCDVDSGYLAQTPFLVDVAVHADILKYNVSVPRERQKIRIGDMLINSCPPAASIAKGSSEAVRYEAGKSLKGQAWFALGEYEQASMNFEEHFDGNWKELLVRTLAFAKSGDPINASYAKAVMMKRMTVSIKEAKQPYLTLKAARAISSALQAEIDYWDDHDVDAFLKWAKRRMLMVERKRYRAKYSVADEYYSIAAACISVNQAVSEMPKEEAKKHSKSLKELVDLLVKKSKSIDAPGLAKCIRWNEPDDTIAMPFFRPYLRKQHLPVRSSAWTSYANNFESRFIEPRGDMSHKVASNQLAEGFVPISIVLGKKVGGFCRKGSVWHREIDSDRLTHREQKVANAFCLALHAQEDIGVWKVLSSEGNFPLKRRIIDSIYQFGIDIDILLDRLDQTGNVQERLSLLETIRHYSTGVLTEFEVNRVIAILGRIEAIGNLEERRLCKIIRLNLNRVADINIQRTVGMTNFAIPTVSNSK